MTKETKQSLKKDDCKPERLYQFLSYYATEASVPNQVSNIRDDALRFAKQAGIDGEDLYDIQIAIGEALSNAVKHGSPVIGKSRISIGCEIVDGSFVVTVSDEGGPFDDKCIPEPEFQELPECGLGVYLMKQLMDHVEFSRNEAGNSVKMVKKLAQAT